MAAIYWRARAEARRFRPICGPARGEPFWLTTGSDRNLWFTEYLTVGIGRITPAGTVTEFSGIGANPAGITTESDGNLWDSSYNGGTIMAVSTAGTILHSFPIPAPGSSPWGITTGPDGNLRFAGGDGNNIGRMTPGGVTTLFPVPTSNSFPDGGAGWSALVHRI